MTGNPHVTPGCPCARCALHALVDQHYTGSHLGDLTTRQVTVDVATVAADFGSILGSLIQAIPERRNRRRATTFAYACIDAGIEAARTGELVPVDTAATDEH